MIPDGELELYNWKINADFLLLEILLQDEKFRKEVCSKCSVEMKAKRECEVYKDGKTFCDKLVKARGKNEGLKKRKKDLIFLSPSLNKSGVLCKMAQTLY